MTRAELLEAYDRDHTHPLNRGLHVLGITLIGASVTLVWFVPWLGVLLFAAGFGAQFVGHGIEGKPPSFTRDPKFMAVGALWYAERVRDLFRRRPRSASHAAD